MRSIGGPHHQFLSQGPTKSISTTVQQSQVQCIVQVLTGSLFKAYFLVYTFQFLLMFISCCLKSPTILLELVFLSQLVSVALCYVEHLLGAA